MFYLPRGCDLEIFVALTVVFRHPNELQFVSDHERAVHADVRRFQNSFQAVRTEHVRAVRQRLDAFVDGRNLRVGRQFRANSAPPNRRFIQGIER